MWINNKIGYIAGGGVVYFWDLEVKTEKIKSWKGMLMETEKITFRVLLVKVFF